LAETVELLYDISRKLNSDLDLDRVLSDILALTMPNMGATDGSIMVFDDTGRVSHRILIRKDLSPEEAAEVTDQVLSRGLAGWVREYRTGAVVDDVHQDDRWLALPGAPLNVRSAIAVPLLRRDKVVGVLTLVHPEPGRFTPEQLPLLMSIANQAAVAVENARLFREVQEERAKLEAIINGANDAILVVDEEDKLVLMNPSAQRLLDAPETADALGRPLAEVVEYQELLSLFAAAAHQAKPRVAEVPLPDGRTLLVSLTPVPGVGRVAVMQDITAFKELENMKTEFVATVSHDLRSPLQLISTYAGLLKDEANLTPNQQRFVEGIQRSVMRMSNLITDLLDLAKIEAGVEMDVEPSDLRAVIPAVVETFAEEARNKGLTLRADIPPDLPLVRGNEARLAQVMQNLLSNAIKYTFEGEVVVTARQEGDEVVVTVRDTGVGIPPKAQERLFEKFYRVPDPRTEAVQGTGLGLAIVRSIIERYGGRVWAESEPGRGSTFAFALPVQDVIPNSGEAQRFSGGEERRIEFAA